MSKKQVNIKPVKKVNKPLKQALTPKKAKSAEAEKSSKTKKAEKPSKKIVTKMVTKKIVTKKSVIKKATKIATKPLKKSVSQPGAKTSPKKAIDKKVVLKAKDVAAKKIVLKKTVSGKIQDGSKVITLVKPIVKQQSKKADKPEKGLKKGEPEKLLKTLKPLKAEVPKPSKAEKTKPRRSKKKKKKDDDDDEPAIGNDPLIEELIRSTKKRHQPKKPKIIQTFVNPMASLTVAPADGGKKSSVPKKEPKGKFELEYVVRTSAGILFEFLTSPSGLSEWFADDVNIRDGIFTFFWDGSEQKARLLAFKEDNYVRMQWLDKPEGSYFEFKIEKDELTGDISLLITDFADEGSDLQTSKRLWDSQVNSLLHVIGSY